jgi:hypothetical protein
MQGLQAVSAFANLLFYGGGLAIVVGILMVVQSQQQTRDSALHVDKTTSNNAGRARESILEEENRRLRDELARSKLNERGDKE